MPPVSDATMSDNFKLEIVEAYGWPTITKQWYTDYRDERGNPIDIGGAERALLVRGVPMVGERVVAPGRVKPATVSGHHVVVRLQTSDGAIGWGVNAEKCSPAPKEDEAQLRAVVEAIDNEVHVTAEALERAARAAIRAMKEGA